jgi:hypothetical protein
MMTPEQDIALKKIAADLTTSMLDNHSGDWDADETAAAFLKILAAVKTGT